MKHSPDNENSYKSTSGIVLYNGDMKLLEPLQWLNDIIIEFYVELVVERSQINPLLPKVYAFNTNFFNKLRRNAASAMRWTMKVDLQSFDIILVPIHLPGHWALSIMDMRKKGVYYFYTMLGDGRDCLRELREFLVLESVAKRGEAFNTMDWTFLSVKTIPTQMNGPDCGVFLCRFAECIARDADTDFKAADMNEFRKKIVQGIKSGKLI
uniref:Ubiquitin-like protease family profile domain-containing protein n=1 Tax=Ditylenchus dipsaci TaxID=166011 RepID=A0A915CTF3_9BILA